MPAATQPRPPRFAAAAALLAGLVALSAGQDPPAREKADAGAFRLPDGTVVFFTKNPDDPNPKIDGVLLFPKEYQALLDKAEQLRKAKEAAKPAAPSECHVRGRVEAKMDRPFAALTLTYSFRTTTPKAAVALGGQRAFLAAAAGGDGKLPLLAATDDGLTVVADEPGPHTLTLHVEVPVGPRGGKGEVGFELGLPRAAITTLALDPPGKDVTKLTVATRTADPPAAGPGKPAEARRVTEDAARFAPKPGANGPPLGPVESLEVTWEAPAAAAPAAAETPVAVEADVAVRVEDTQVETTARLRLRGPAREWPLVLPPGATVAAERASGPAGAADRTPTVTRPADPKQPGWSVQTPDGGEWVATVTVRQPRPDPKHPGPYPVGPFFAPGVARQSGTVRVFAPPTTKAAYTAPREVRLQDAPAGGGEDAPVLVFRYATPPAKDGKPLPLLDLDVRPARGLVLVQPAHKLRLTEAGWRLRTDLKVTPVRTELDALAVELPAGWETLDALPPELVEEVRPGPDRRFTVRLAAPQKGPFDLVLEATWRVPPAAREAAVPLPRFPDAAERGAQVAVGVPEGFEVRAAAREWDGKQPAALPTDLKPAAAPAGAAVTSVAGKLDAGAARVDVAWQPFRPELAADVRADVTLYERQAEVVQTVRLSAAGVLPPVRFTGPPTPAGFSSRVLDPAGPGRWTFTPGAGEKEAAVTLRYAVPLAPGPGGGVPVPLVWPDATRVEAAVRVWAGGGHRVARFDGPWRERPPEPDPDRDALPALTLAGGGAGLPLALTLADAADGSAPVVIDRGAVLAKVADDGATRVEARYVLRRWSSAGVEVELPAATQVEVFVDRKRVQAVEVRDRVVRVPLPEARPARPTVELAVSYAPPPARAGFGEVVLTPPLVRGAAARAPVRWRLAVPASSIPLVLDPGFAPEARWQWRDWRFAPVPSGTPADLDAWLAGGADPGEADDDGPAWTLPGGEEVVAGRQGAAGRLRVVRASRAAVTLAWSVLAFAVGLVVARLRPGLLGPAVALIGVAAALWAVLLPQPAGQVAAAAQPGLAALALVLAAWAARRWYYRRRLTHLPTFTRGAPAEPPAGPVAGSGAGRSSRNGAADGGRTGSSIPPLTPAGSG